MQLLRLNVLVVVAHQIHQLRLSVARLDRRRRRVVVRAGDERRWLRQMSVMVHAGCQRLPRRRRRRRFLSSDRAVLRAFFLLHVAVIAAVEAVHSHHLVVRVAMAAVHHSVHHSEIVIHLVGVDGRLGHHVAVAGGAPDVARGRHEVVDRTVRVMMSVAQLSDIGERRAQVLLERELLFLLQLSLGVVADDAVGVLRHVQTQRKLSLSPRCFSILLLLLLMLRMLLDVVLKIN